VFGLGTSEIIIVLVLALLVFGPQKLPEIGRQIGGLMREFRRMSDDVRRTFDVEELTGLSRYDDPFSTKSYHPATSYEPDLDNPQYDAAYPRLDQQMSGGDGIDEIKTVSPTNGHGGAAVYDAPRPWSLSGDNHLDDLDVTSEPATARFTPVVTVEPPGPHRTSNGGELSPPQQKEQ
jgi:Tat protein translocase TatB subunit